MKFQKLATLAALVPYVLAVPNVANFPAYRSLAGLTHEEIRAVAATFDDMPGPQPLPPPINDTSAKLVNDAGHPFMPLQPGDIRGPCPGLNTLASHGYINRTGIVTPAEMITGVQEGFNMGYYFSSFLTYGGFLVDGNHLTNMISIGANTTVDGNFITGLDTHGTFEGRIFALQDSDVSITRQDAYFGNNFDFNETLFDLLVQQANEMGNGIITQEVAAYNRRVLAQNGIATNPEFAYRTPRYLGAAAESGFILAMWANNQTEDLQQPLTLDEARHFFDYHMFPDGFVRRQGPFEFPQVISLTDEILKMVDVPPGTNNGAGNYTVDTTDIYTYCQFYQRQANATRRVYPNPPPDLEAAIKVNLQTFYTSLNDPTCPQVYPFGM